MNRYARYFCLLSFIIFPFNLVSAQETIRVSVGEYPPAYSEYSLHYGYIPHILTRAYNLVGIQVKLEFLPWKRAYQNAKEGQFDATCCWFSSRQRQQDFFLSDAISNTEGFYFFHLKSYNFDWQTLKDLQGIPIGATSGYTFGEEFYRAEKEGKLTVQWVNADQQSLGKLFKKRIAIAPIDINTGYELLRRYFPAQQAQLVTHHPKALRRTPTYFLLSRNKGQQEKSQRLMALFNKGLKLLKQNGEYDKIIADVRRGEYAMKPEKWIKQ